MLDIKQYTAEIVIPTLEHLALYSKAAENLIVGTAVQESHLTYLRQVGGGPALGVCQMEPATHDDIWENYLSYRSELKNRVDRLLAPYKPKVEQLVGNMPYAVAMTRVHYMRVPHALPSADDAEALGQYWKAHYNTEQGAGTVAEFVLNYRKYVRA